MKSLIGPSIDRSKTIEVGIGQDDVILHLEGALNVLAMKSDIEITLKNRGGVSTETGEPPWLAGKNGTHIPGAFMAGTFCIEKDKIFYYVRNGSKCITLRLKNHEYSKLMSEVPDKESIARHLRNAID